jgi:hypothetical protein
MSNLTDADLYINFSPMANTTPYTNAALTANYLNSGAINVEVLSGVLTIHNNGLYDADIGVAATPTASIISAVAKVAYPSDFQSLVIVNPATGNGFALRGVGTLRLHTFTSWGFDSGGALTFGSTTLADNDDYQIQYNGTQIISLKNDVVEFTYNLSAGEIATLGANPKPWWYYNADNVGAGGIRAIGFDYLDASALTINTTPANNRVTESRTIRATAPTTAITTGNTTIKINSADNSAITPTSVTVVSGLTVDIAYTVPDVYAGLPYSASGYPIIVTSTDGTVSSSNVPFLPVTGNGYVTLTVGGNGDFNTSLGTLAAGDQIEWTNIAVITDVSSSAAITSNLAVTTFSARAWDDTDDTWGSYALQTWGASSDANDSGGLTSYDLTSSGLVKYGLVL